jgi:hypothetical protein
VVLVDEVVETPERAMVVAVAPGVLEPPVPEARPLVPPATVVVVVVVVASSARPLAVALDER